MGTSLTDWLYSSVPEERPILDLLPKINGEVVFLFQLGAYYFAFDDGAQTLHQSIGSKLYQSKVGKRKFYWSFVHSTKYELRTIQHLTKSLIVLVRN